MNSDPPDEFPGQHQETVFRPGDHLPLWAVEVLASDPLLPQAWWDNEVLCLQAAGAGFLGPAAMPPPPPPIDDGTAWEPYADDIVSGRIKMDLRSSEVQSIEIGVRGYPQNSKCRAAYAVFLKARAEAKTAKQHRGGG